MRILKKTGIALLVVITGIQFIQPGHNKSGKTLPEDIVNIYPVPGNVLGALKTACYDCHSNNTSYPWYTYVQPGGWLMARHIRKGKAELNFSEFGSYSLRRQASKMKAIADNITDGTMPLGSYKLLHRDARLTEQDKSLIIEWAMKRKDSLLSEN